MLKRYLNELLSYPLLTSAWLLLYSLLIFLPLIRPPVILTLILVSLLVYLSIRLGAIFERLRHGSGAGSGSPS